MLEVSHIDTSTNLEYPEVDLPNLQRRIDTQVAVLQEAFKRLSSLKPLRLDLEQEPREEALRYATNPL